MSLLQDSNGSSFQSIHAGSELIPKMAIMKEEGLEHELHNPILHCSPTAMMKGSAEHPLVKAINKVLSPSGLRERLRMRLSSGYTAKQILHRLPPHLREALVPAETHPSQTQSAALSALEITLKDMCQRGHLKRNTVKIQEQDGRGVRRLQLDVYRL